MLTFRPLLPSAFVAAFGLPLVGHAAENTPPSNEHSADRHFRVSGGSGAIAFTRGGGAAAFDLALHYQTSGRHAFVVGPRGGLALPSGSDLVVLGLDVGYRGVLVDGSIRLGIVAAFQTQAWIPTRSPRVSPSLFGEGVPLAIREEFSRAVEDVPATHYTNLYLGGVVGTRVGERT